MTRPEWPGALGPGEFRARLTLVVLSTFLAMLAYTGPLGNAVTLAASLRSSPSGTSWILASMSAGLAVALLPVGVIADRLGRGRIFTLGAATFGVSNLAAALAEQTWTFVAARIAAGLGAAGVISTGLGLVAVVVESTRQRTITATGWSAAMGAGIALGPVLAGMLDLADLWRLYYLVLAIGGMALWAAARRLADQPESYRRPADPWGFVLLTLFLIALITAIIEARTAETSRAIALFAVAGLLFGGLLVSQRVGSRRIVDAGLFGHRPFLAATCAGFGTGLGVIAVMSCASTYLVDGFSVSTVYAGSVVAAWSGTSAVAAIAFARYADALSGRTPLVGGLVGVGAGMALLAVVGDGGAVNMVPGLVVAGVASGLLNTGLARQSVATVPARDAATGTSVNNTARYLGASIGVSVGSVLLTHGDLHTGWTWVAWSGAAASVLCAFVVLVLSPRPRPAAPATG